MSYAAIEARLNTPCDKPMTIGALVFAGGFSFGMEEAGFEVIGHLELNDLRLGSETSKQRWPVQVSSAEQHLHWAKGIAERGLTPTCLHMNPPCAAFAKQGARKGMADECMSKTRFCIDLALTLRPQAWVWELVPDVWKMPDGRAFVEETARRAADAGYSVCVFLTSAALHGGYQDRQRFHFVAVRGAGNRPFIDWAKTAELVYSAEPPERKGWRPVGQVLEIVDRAEDPLNHEKERLSGGQLLSLMPYCPPGGYLRDLNDDVMKMAYKPRGKDWDGVDVAGRAGVTQARARLDRASPVIVGGTSVIHPTKDRFLTVREAATIMGFPLDYKFSYGTAGYQEVGKGLCTHNASFVGRLILSALAAPVDGTNADVIQEVDFTPKVRGTVPSLSATREERRKWWAEKHPDLPIELADPRPKGKPGRPAGSPNRQRQPSEGTAPLPPRIKSVIVAADEELLAALVKLGINAADLTISPIVETVAQVKRFDALIVDDEADFYAGTIAHGAALALGKLVVPPRDGTVNKRAVDVAEMLGMEKSEITKKLMAGIDPAKLLELAMGLAS